MKAPDLPPDELSRLKTLKSLNILDTPPEERFDRLTRMAKRVFDVPIALVSLIDENRQWFKSCIGLTAEETPRDISFCGHAILGDEVLTIEDATKDNRFADNPLVTDDPNIRFYAGCPLKTMNGTKLGTLCIIDQEPRTISGEDVDTLEDLASMVEREISMVNLATQDELTDIKNRRGFLLLAQQSLGLCTRQNIPASLAFFDLNNFKPINDKFGHAEGDRALKDFASQMKNTLRESDIFARLGGDEFVVLLTNTAIDLARDIVLRFRKLLDQFNQENNRGYEITFSFGLVEYDVEKHPTVEALLTEGDGLMYERKKLLGNR